MKVAFSITGESLESPLDPRFGRAARFLLVDLETDLVRLIENDEARAATQGAGIQAAEMVARAGASAVVTGHCGPKAFQVLRQAGVKVYPSPVTSVTEALGKLRAGTLVEQLQADVAGHHA